MTEPPGEPPIAQPQSRPDVGRALDRLLDAEGRSLAADTKAHLIELALLVADWGSAMNLTGYRDPADIMGRLICDGLALWERVRPLRSERSGGVLADLGSGAGFPGLPVALVAPDLEVVLVESRLRRHHFQRAARRKLGLGRVDARLGRIEELPPTRSDWVIAQAVARPHDALALGVRWLRPGGVIVIPGNEPSLDPGPHTEVCEFGVLDYQVPDRSETRWLWWGRKRAE